VLAFFLHHRSTAFLCAVDIGGIQKHSIMCVAQLSAPYYLNSVGRVTVTLAVRSRREPSVHLSFGATAGLGG
jgi:hypothetical protein